MKKKISLILTVLTLAAVGKYADYSNYKQSLIDAYSQETFKLMNIEAGIKGELHSYLYYIVNNK